MTASLAADLGTRVLLTANSRGLTMGLAPKHCRFSSFRGFGTRLRPEVDLHETALETWRKVGVNFGILDLSAG